MRTVGIYPDKDALEEQYDEGYFGRVYRTSVVVFGMAAALVAALSPEPVPAQRVTEAVARGRRSGAAPVPAHRERAAARARPAGAPAQQGPPAALPAAD